MFYDDTGGIEFGNTSAGGTGGGGGIGDTLSGVLQRGLALGEIYAAKRIDIDLQRRLGAREIAPQVLPSQAVNRDALDAGLVRPRYSAGEASTRVAGNWAMMPWLGVGGLVLVGALLLAKR